MTTLANAPVFTAPNRGLKRCWVLPAALLDQLQVQALSRGLGSPPLVAEILLRRGLGNSADAAAFLQPKLNSLPDPALLPNMAAAVDRIAQAALRREKIVIFGDYDVDGTTGTAMLWRLLKAAGADVHFRVPHRTQEGYGLQTPAVVELVDGGAQLIITVDCGITANQPVALAQSRGVDVIVTDHHEFHEPLPPARAIVHPNLPGSLYPNKHLCGAGVAFKLCWQLARSFCGGPRVSQLYRDMLVEFCALVGLATIADVVPLSGENRVLAHLGLRQLRRSTIVGIQALVDAAGCREKIIDCTAAGFALSPRLNAAGRMGHARLAVEMLITDSPPRAAEIAGYLEKQNRERQGVERKIFAAAKAQVPADQLPAALVVSGKEFHAGVVGIVASRLVDAFHRPAFVLAVENDLAVGSGRSIVGFALHEAIEHCRDLLITGGGHAMAGGVKLKADKMEEFSARLRAYAAEHLVADDFIPRLHVEAQVRLAQLDIHMAKHLALMEPFGNANTRPQFLVREAHIAGPPRRVGATGNHLQLTLQQDGAMGRAIAFGLGPWAAQLPNRQVVDLIVDARLSHYNGNTGVDLHIVDIARSDGRSFT